jgi:hypothetical protein
MNHRDEVVNVLKKEIGRDSEVDDIRDTALRVSQKWVKPLSGGEEQTNGLIYGLIQSGKTGVLTVTGAIGADEGYRTLIILTSDNDPLYAQTLSRVRQSFPGMDILGKPDFKDTDAFLRRVKGRTCAIVTTKNAGILGTLIENFTKGNLKGLTALIFDDEADQASLNTRESRDDGTRSTINDRIARLRSFFAKNTYLQVTATPQAMFLQTPNHDFRPRFTVLSNPGSDYVGGNDFFSDGSTLIREFPITEIQALSPGSQPQPSLSIPPSLLRALDTFMVAATHKRMIDATQNSAFLCHVSTRKDDHAHIERLLRLYTANLAALGTPGGKALENRLRTAYDDLASTHREMRNTPFGEIVQRIAFYSASATVKLVNGDTDEDVAVLSPYNLFVGGNKLGRGVTIKNLLVSYYGRNPARPQADTVLQHARMYGYRRKDIGLLRLFLPPELHVLFKAIHKMEVGLRALVERNPDEAVRGIFIEGPSLRATRPNVLLPGAIGIYAGGATYNPAQVLRDASAASAAADIDGIVRGVASKKWVELPLSEIRKIVGLVRPDEALSGGIWNSAVIGESISQVAGIKKQETGYVYVDRDRGLREARGESQGILSGGEAGEVPSDKVTLFLLRTKPEKGETAAWWPQVRFPAGQYAIAFSI